MSVLRRLRFSMRTMLMFVLTAAVASALFVKIRTLAEPIQDAGWKLDVPSLFLLALVLTSTALAAWKGHTPVQGMLQIGLACLVCLSFLWIADAKQERIIRYWYQAGFGLMFTLPMIGRTYVKKAMPRGPRREWWKGLFECLIFAWLTTLLLAVGALIQAGLYALASGVLAK